MRSATHRRFGSGATRRRAFQPGVVAAEGNLQNAAHRQHRNVGLVRSHEPVVGPGPESASRANQSWLLPGSPLRYAFACSHREGAAALPSPGDSARRGAHPLIAFGLDHPAADRLFGRLEFLGLRLRATTPLVRAPPPIVGIPADTGPLISAWLDILLSQEMKCPRNRIKSKEWFGKGLISFWI